MSVGAVNNEIRGILNLLAEAKKVEERARSIFSQADEKTEKLRKNILKTGATTGDNIKDFIIVRHGLNNPKYEAIYRDLETRVREHGGEFVLVNIKRQEKFLHRHTVVHDLMPDHDDFVVTRETLYLGVLKGDSLILNLADGDCQFPTGCYAWWSSGEEVELIEKDLASFWLKNIVSDLNMSPEDNGLKDLVTQLGLGMFNKESRPMLEIKIGDAEVQAWFKEQWNKRLLMVFKKMGDVLKRPITEFPELAEELQRRRKAVAERLGELAKERNQIKERVKPPPELQKIEEKIREQLEIARQLGVPDNQIEQLRRGCDMEAP